MRTCTRDWCHAENCGLSEAEHRLMDHVTRWGSDGYPVRKVGRGWHVEQSFGVEGIPMVFKTKREAVEAFERWHALMLDKHAGRI